MSLSIHNNYNEKSCNNYQIQYVKLPYPREHCEAAMKNKIKQTAQKKFLYFKLQICTKNDGIVSAN